MKSAFLQKQSESALFLQVVIINQVFRHWGKIVGHGTGGAGGGAAGELGAGGAGGGGPWEGGGATHIVQTVLMLVLVIVETVVVVATTGGLPGVDMVVVTGQVVTVV